MVKIVDFGLAVNLTPEKPFATSEAGTPYYMSPEIIRKEPYHYPADCWSLGVILHEMLTLSLPFTARDTKEFVHKLLHENPPEVSRHYSEEIKHLHQGLLDKNQSSRFNTKEVLRHSQLYNKAVSFSNSYRPKALEDKVRRAYSRILLKQVPSANSVHRLDVVRQCYSTNFWYIYRCLIFQQALRLQHQAGPHFPLLQVVQQSKGENGHLRQSWVVQ